MEPKGAWIFVSHSNKDIEKVREVRNWLEQNGDNPILFFLKSVGEGGADDTLLWQLIEREIRAREWFVLCDSPHARVSRAVQREIELVQAITQEGRDRETIDLSVNLQPQLHKLKRISKRATVFISYSRDDTEVAVRIRDALAKRDFRVWMDASSTGPGLDFSSAVNKAIDDAVAQGFVLVLLSPALLRSPFCKYEAEYALQLAAKSSRSNVVPLIIAPFEPEQIPAQLANLAWFDLTTGLFEQRMDDLIRNLKAREME